MNQSNKDILIRQYQLKNVCYFYNSLWEVSKYFDNNSLLILRLFNAGQQDLIQI